MVVFWLVDVVGFMWPTQGFHVNAPADMLGFLVLGLRVIAPNAIYCHGLTEVLGHAYCQCTSYLHCIYLSVSFLSGIVSDKQSSGRIQYYRYSSDE